MAGGVEVHVLFPTYMSVAYLDSASLVDIVTLNEPNDTLANLPVYRIVTKAKGYPIDGRLYSLYIAGIAPGAFRDIDFMVKSATGTDKIYSWVIGPLSGSDERSWVSDCNKARLKTGADLVFDGLSLVPGVDCVANVAKAAIGGLYSGLSYLFGSSSGESVAAGIGKNVAGVVKNCAGEISAATGVGLVSGVAPAIEMADLTTDVMILESNLAVNLEELRAKCPEEQPKPKEKPVEVRTSFDPNAKSGPSGYTPAVYINNRDKVMNYTIFFENLPAATLPAQEVRIVDTLDKNVYDLSTFRAVSFAIGQNKYNLPMDGSDYLMDVPYATDFDARFSLALDTATGVITSSLRSIDKATGTAPENPLEGFLPPNINGPDGEGHVSFVIHMRNGLADGTGINNKAAIYFDENEPIITDTWLNTIDDNRPVSQVLSATQLSDTTMVVKVNGSDLTSGIRHYLLYVSDNGGDYNYAVKITGDSAILIGELGHTYTMYTRAVDSVGNDELKSPGAEATITLNELLPVTLTLFTGQVMDGGNELRWTTATEINNKGFYVERSVDGRIFTQLEYIASKAVNGNSTTPLSYNFMDKEPTAKSYYRLRQIDFDGTANYSTTILLERKVDYALVIAPNPAVNHFRVSSDKQITGLRLVDMQGRVVKVFTPGNSGNYQLGQTPPGIYILQINIEGHMHTHRLSVMK